MTERRTHPSPEDLLQQDRYTPDEAAELLEIGIDVVRHAVFTGDLRAQVVEHDIISIDRVDVLAWWRASEAEEPLPDEDISI